MSKYSWIYETSDFIVSYVWKAYDFLVCFQFLSIEKSFGTNITPNSFKNITTSENLGS